MLKGKKIKLSETENAAKEIGGKLVGGEIIGLIGGLGSGKTTLTQLIGKSLSVKRQITSPTFLVMQQYKGNLNTSEKAITLYHLDLYRTSSFDEVEQLGITELWGRPETVTIIEWADKIANFLPKTAKIFFLKR